MCCVDPLSIVSELQDGSTRFWNSAHVLVRVQSYFFHTLAIKEICDVDHQRGANKRLCVHLYIDLPTFSQYDVFFSMDSALTDQSSYARASGCLLDVMAALVHVMTDFL